EMSGTMLHRALPRLAVALLLATGALLVLALPARAQDVCQNAGSGCVTVTSPLITIRPLRSVSRSLPCPSDHPAVWGTDFESNSRAVTGGSGRYGSSGWFIATNWSATTSHTVTFYVGCV